MSNEMGTPPIPAALMAGVPMLKISSKKIKQVIMRLENGEISWTGRNNSKVPLSQIRDIRLGEPPSETYSSSRWITIVYVKGSQWKVLHMIALTDEVYDAWVSALPTLVSESSDRLVGEFRPCDPDLFWIRQLWPAGSRMIDFATALGLCRSIGINVPEDANKGKAALDLSDFRDLIKEVADRPEMQSVFERLSLGNRTMNKHQVQGFLRDVQKVDPSDIFERFGDDGGWTVESLQSFLTSSQNTSVKPEDLTLPLSDYYISSSHNTYLVGEQWRGESTVEGYIRVLLGGGRSVEIDVHNGDYEPVVHHKKTFTTSVSVRDICRAINRYGFIASPYPIIISAEIHCDPSQQHRLATIMREIFGEKLVTAPIDQHDESNQLPSPERLKNRILFKAKPREEYMPSTSPVLARYDTSFESNDSTAESDASLASMVRRISFGSPKTSQPIYDKRPAFSKSLADLLVYTFGVKYRGFSKLNAYDAQEQFSVSDRTAERILKESKSDWIKHNFTHLSRVYPKAIRVQSSNFDPQPFWSAGCQLVALNWQTMDEGLLLNHAMFIDTPGYVLKPLALRQKTVETPLKYHVSLEVISAQRLPLGSDLYVEATLGDLDPQRTSAIRGTALNPRWDKKIEWILEATPTEFHLTFLNLSIKNRILLAHWIRPLSRVPCGYHHLPLYDSLCSKYVFATLFVRIDVEVLSHAI